MVQSKKICVLLLLAVLFVGTESARWCFYYDAFGEIVILRCPYGPLYATADSSGGGGDASKGCTKENPCPYDGEKS
ncbi:hypothetical protein QE152_g12632 [Popillia japonica]|uniref:Uncharacterized protein n=1 Tax=Popillia japonica TaxID=7064 RepID=A0AAW1LIQ5_POPJA